MEDMIATIQTGNPIEKGVCFCFGVVVLVVVLRGGGAFCRRSRLGGGTVQGGGGRLQSER
jgi:hypothetical protein